jgi:hypothetical protein
VFLRGHYLMSRAGSMPWQSSCMLPLDPWPCCSLPAWHSGS